VGGGGSLIFAPNLYEGIFVFSIILFILT